MLFDQRTEVCIYLLKIRDHQVINKNNKQINEMILKFDSIDCFYILIQILSYLI